MKSANPPSPDEPWPVSTGYHISTSNDDYMVPSITAPGLIPMQPDSPEDDKSELRPMKLVGRNAGIPSYGADIHHGVDSSAISMNSALGNWQSQEEDEDSDGQDYEAPPLAASAVKPVSRMKYAKSRVSRQRNTKQNSRNRQGQGAHGANNRNQHYSGSGLFLKDVDVSNDVVETTPKDNIHENFNSTTSSFEVQDFDDSSSQNSAYNEAEQSNDSVLLSLSLNDHSQSQNNGNDDESVNTNASSRSGRGSLQINISDQELKEAFDNCVVDGKGDNAEANKNKLCLEFYSIGASVLADRLRGVPAATVTWSQLSDLRRGKQIKPRPKIGASSFTSGMNNNDFSRDNGPRILLGSGSVQDEPEPEKQVVPARDTFTRNRISVASLMRPPQPAAESQQRTSAMMTRESRDTVLVASQDYHAHAHSVVGHDVSKERHSPSSEVDHHRRVSWASAQSTSSLDEGLMKASHNNATLDMESEDDADADKGADSVPESPSYQHLSDWTTTTSASGARRLISVSVPKSPMAIKTDFRAVSDEELHERTQNSMDSQPMTQRSVDSQPLEVEVVHEQRIPAATKPPLHSGGRPHTKLPDDFGGVQSSVDRSTHSRDSNDSERDSESNCDPGDQDRDLQDCLTMLLPPLSVFAQRSGIIFEGWLDKQSSSTRMWLNRYYVLSECDNEYCVLKCFTSATESAWGSIGIQLRDVIPIRALASVKMVTKKSAKGQQFKMDLHVDAKGGYVSRQSNQPTKPESENEGKSGTKKASTKTLKFRAPNPQTRLIWMTLLQMAAQAARESD